MLVKEFFELKQVPDTQMVTFIKVRARKDANTPFYHAEYQTTPIRNANEWNHLSDYIVLNDEVPPIEWAGTMTWNNWFDKEVLLSILIIRKEDFLLLYKEKQAEELIERIDKTIREKLNKQ